MEWVLPRPGIFTRFLDRPAKPEPVKNCGCTNPLSIQPGIGLGPAAQSGLNPNDWGFFVQGTATNLPIVGSTGFTWSAAQFNYSVFKNAVFVSGDSRIRSTAGATRMNIQVDGEATLTTGFGDVGVQTVTGLQIQMFTSGTQTRQAGHIVKGFPYNGTYPWLANLDSAGWNANRFDMGMNQFSTLGMNGTATFGFTFFAIPL